MIVSDPQRKKSGTLCEEETVRINFQPTQQQTPALVLAAVRIRGTTDENPAYLKRKSAAQK